MSLRIAIGSIMHESHAFSPRRTRLADFESGHLLLGSDLVPFFAGTRTEPAAFLAAGEREGWQCVPLLAARATPNGLVEAEAYRGLQGELVARLQAALPVDGVLLALHGAMGAEGLPDADGDLLAAVRSVVGPDIPVIATLDMHANVTGQMVSATTALIGYQTYPHVDQYERGAEAASLMARTLRGEVRPVTARVSPPALLTSMNMRTAEGPMAALVGAARALAEEPGILAATVFGGFPYADFPECGPAAVVVADGSAERARSAARRLAREIWRRRKEFRAELLSPREAVRRAQALLGRPGSGPIALVDVADNPASGGTGDTTGLLAAMLEAGFQNAAFGTLYDPESVAQAVQAGVGGTAELQLGGKSAPQFGGPLRVKATVRTLADGRFRNRGPMNHGMEIQMGRTAVVQVGGLQVVLTEFPVAPADPEAFRRVGIDPADLSVLGIKAKNHFRAGYGPFLRQILLVDAPGLATLDLSQVPYTAVRRPVWPLDPDTAWGEDEEDA